MTTNINGAMSMDIVDLDSIQDEVPFGPSTRSELWSRLKSAKRSGVALLIAGSEDSWGHNIGDDDHLSARAQFHALVLLILRHPAPVVACADGHVSGFGLSVFTAADIRIATRSITFQIGQEAGVTALTTGSFRLLTDRLNRSTAEDLVYTGRIVGGEEALAIGLLTIQQEVADNNIEEISDLVSGPAPSAVKRAAIAALPSALSELLDYDAWLALTAAGE